MIDTSSPKVTPKSDRIIFLDVLRGIAIQFIFIANVIYFSGYYDFKETTRWISTALASDKVLEYLMYTLVDGKFYSIFSLLFGIGCVIQYENMRSHGKSFSKFFGKRMFWLMVFGLIHLIGFWMGDILTLYAVLGFALIPCIRLKDKKLITFAIILILFPIANDLIMFVLGVFYPQPVFNTATDIYTLYGLPLSENNGMVFPDFKAYLLNTNLSDFFKMNFGNAFVRIGAILMEGRIFKVFGIFLIGLWAGRHIIHKQLLNNQKFLIRAAIIGFGMGLPFSLLRTYIEFFADKNSVWGLIHTVSYALGTVPMAIGLSAGLALLLKEFPKFLSWLAPVGKMAFTNYILQTVSCIVIFYGIGFGLGGTWGYTVVLLFAISFFLLQAALSKIWLSYFYFGPLEWIWRQLTYGKRFPMKRKSRT